MKYRLLDESVKKIILSHTKDYDLELPDMDVEVKDDRIILTVKSGITLSLPNKKKANDA